MGKYDVEKKVERYMQKNGMLPTEGGIVAGVSGGADSLCMLLILEKLCGKRSVPLHVVHVHHGVREDAGEDAAFVEQLCGRLKLPFVLEKVNMEGYALQEGLSGEEAGRVLRYQTFERYKTEHGLSRIAVAHNRDDRAETMLFNLFRGTGIKGLAAILPVREDVIRPVLCLERHEIEAYLRECGMSYREDSTNASDIYTRNRIRHHILPYVKAEISPQAVKHMNDTAQQLCEIQEYIERRAGTAFRQCVRKTEEGLVLDISSFHRQDPVIGKQILLQCFMEMTPHRKDITSAHIEGLLHLMCVSGSTVGHFPYGLEAVKEYDSLILRKKADGAAAEAQSFLLLKGGAPEDELPFREFCLKDLGKMTCEIIDDPRVVQGMYQNIEQNEYTKCFDYDKITTSVFVRTRRTGDYFIFDSEGRRKSLKDYMIDEKIPRGKRDSMWLIAEGSLVVWLPGYRISESRKMDEHTKRILKLCVREENDGRTC